MTILVIGRNGQLARALTQRVGAHELGIIARGRPEIDLENTDDVESAILECDPSVVINAAAYTAVDKAEDDMVRAFAVNAYGAEIVARAAAKARAPVVHISTDYVFDGTKASPYLETDPAAPLGVYGASKFEGEQRALAVNPRTIIVRTAWVYDSIGLNFVRTMLRLAQTRPEISVVADQYGCPTYARDLADAVLAMARNPNCFGIYHCCGMGSASWADFAGEIFAQSAKRGGPSANVKAIATAAYPTRAKRPANSRLACTKLEADYRIRMRPWREALSDCVDEIAAGGWSLQ